MAIEYSEDISNNLNDIRVELTIANQLKVIEIFASEGEWIDKTGNHEARQKFLELAQKLLT
jgi:hypothetical protein